MKFRYFVATLLFSLLATSVAAQVQPTASSLPADFIGLKSRLSAQPVVMRYDLRYRVVSKENVVKILALIKSELNNPYLINIQPKEYGWEIELRDDSQAALDSADRFVEAFGILVDRRGQVYSLPEHMELFDLLYVGPQPKQIAGRRVELNGQNDISFLAKKGDEQKIIDLAQEEGFLAYNVITFRGTIILNKAHAWTWTEILPRIAKALQ